MKEKYYQATLYYKPSNKFEVKEIPAVKIPSFDPEKFLGQIYTSSNDLSSCTFTVGHTPEEAKNYLIHHIKNRKTKLFEEIDELDRDEYLINSI